MRPGHSTSEYAVSRVWCSLAWFAIAANAGVAFAGWPAALALAPVTLMTLFAASIIAENYCDARLQLKLGPEPEEGGQKEAFGFRLVPQQEREEVDE